MNDAARERWAAIRLAYEAGAASVKAICRSFHVTNWDLYAVAREQGWRMRGRATSAKIKAGAGDRRRLIEKLYQSLARQMRESEQDVADMTTESARERQARTLSSLTRTLEKLVELENGLDAADHGKKKRQRDKRAAEDLREHLAQKLLRLTRRGRAAGAAEGPSRK
jgi:hypothetical protein